MMPSEVILRTVPNGACLEYVGSRSTAGYGTVNTGGRRYDFAHRIVYREEVGPIPRGMLVMHTCDNPPCVNVEHLRLGTYRDNAADMVAKGRARPGSPRRGLDWLPPRFTVERAGALRAEYAAGGWTHARLAARERVAIVTMARLLGGRSYR